MIAIQAWKLNSSLRVTLESIAGSRLHSAFSSGLCWRLVTNRHTHSFANLVHGRGGSARSFTGTFLKNIPSQLGIVLVFFAARLHGLENAHERIRSPALALDTSYASAATTGIYFGNSCRIAKYLVQISDRTDVGIAGIGATNACRIGDHGLQFLPNHGLGISQHYGVVVRLRHLAAISAGQLGCGSQQRLRLRENVRSSRAIEHVEAT